MNAYGDVLNLWGRTMRPGWANRNRAAVGLPPLPTTRNMTDRAPVVTCDAHPATGGPHTGPGLYVGEYFDTGATLWACTHRSRKGKACGAIGLELP